ncbi:MAG TPA: hypothetical protein VNR87_15150 [Flavisolibacter sp.]|nr:hypothetical protein [Flavisolibacter sp.]
MTKFSLTVFLVTFLASCKSPNTPKVEIASKQDTTKREIASKSLDTTSIKKLGFYTLEADSVVVPPFEIEVSLSSKAKNRIVDSNETIVIDVFLEGTPKDPKKAHLEEDGSFYVGAAKREIVYGQAARFDNLKFPKKLYDQLADKDADLTVNIYTGRKSSQNNLITGDFLSDKVSNVINRHFTLKQKLIWGDD